MTSYWYSTNGVSQRRLSIRHLSILDQAFERHARIQLYDDEVFGHNVPAIANPYQGTMTAGDLHFGLYRQPPMWRMSDTSLDTLILMDSDSQIHEAINNLNLSNNSATKNRHSNGDENNGVNNNSNNNMLPNNNRMSDASLDDNNSPRGVIVNGLNNNNGNNRYKYIQRKRMTFSQTAATATAAEDNCVCCRIS